MDGSNYIKVCKYPAQTNSHPHISPLFSLVPHESTPTKTFQLVLAFKVQFEESTKLNLTSTSLSAKYHIHDTGFLKV